MRVATPPPRDRLFFFSYLGFLVCWWVGGWVGRGRLKKRKPSPPLRCNGSVDLWPAGSQGGRINPAGPPPLPPTHRPAPCGRRGRGEVHRVEATARARLRLEGRDRGDRKGTHARPALIHPAVVGGGLVPNSASYGACSAYAKPLAVIPGRLVLAIRPAVSWGDSQNLCPYARFLLD